MSAEGPSSPPSAGPAAATGAAPGLVRALGFWDSVSLILGIMIGSGIFLVAGAVALQLDSLVAVVAVWLLGGLLSLCGALALSELGAALPSAGGLYVYLARVYGPGTGFVYGWSAMALIHAGGLASLAAAIGLYATPLLGLSTLGTRLLQLAVLALFVAINCLGVAVGKWVQNALTAVKVAGLAAMTAMLYASGSAARLAEHWTRPAPVASGAAWGLALVAVLWAYDGWHFLSFAAGEVKRPTHTLPASLLTGTALTCGIYLVVNLAYYAVLAPEAIRGAPRVASTAIEQGYGPGAALALSLLIAVSVLGAMNGILLGSSRVIYAMAADGLFFRSFARVSPRFHTPVVAIVTQGVLAAAFTLVGTFQQLFTLFIFTAWIYYGLAVAGVMVLRRREPSLVRPFRCPLYPVTPLFFLAATVFIVGSNFATGFWAAAGSVGLMLAGVPLYLLFRARERRATTAP